jgi:hypothetical protein
LVTRRAVNSKTRRRAKRDARWRPDAAKLIRDGDAYLRIRPPIATRPEEIEQILAQNKIWFSSIRNQDDGFEGDPKVEWRGGFPSEDQVLGLARRMLQDEEEARQQAHRILDRLANPVVFEQMKVDLKARIKDLYAESSITSFFRDPLRAGFWDQYSDRGKGYGLIFNMATPWHFIAMLDTSPNKWVPFEVAYVPPLDRPSIPVDATRVTPEAGFDDIKTALLTKSDEWAAQREERFIRVGIPNGLVDFPPDSLRAVVLGHDISGEDKKTILKLAAKRSNRISVFSSVRSPQYYALDLRRIF